MTAMHQKQTIEDTMKRECDGFDKFNGIDIALNSGYGPSLVWKVYEFKPRTPELLHQFQFVQDFKTKTIVRNTKWSPPLSLLKLDASDDDHFGKYLDQLLEPEYLKHFGYHFYAEEVVVHEPAFQAELLSEMCDYYLNLPEGELKKSLSSVLRMLIVTYIMSHTLTIAPEDLSFVCQSIRYTEVPHDVPTAKHISPRLANRQLKFFFAQMRLKLYDTVLKHYQATLRVYKKGVKENTWVESFFTVLGLAMVLEEIQRTLLINADAQIKKNELSKQLADEQAANAFDRIDDRFTLLIGLFRCKYRDRHWDNEKGTFGPETPELEDPLAVDFLTAVRTLVEKNADHLKERDEVSYSPENQCQFTTRLTAKFLRTFLNLKP